MNNVKNMFLYVLLAAIHFECPQVRPVGIDFVWAMGRDTVKALDVLRQKFWTSDFISWILDYYILIMIHRSYIKQNKQSQALGKENVML